MMLRAVVNPRYAKRLAFRRIDRDRRRELMNHVTVLRLYAAFLGMGAMQV